MLKYNSSQTHKEIFQQPDVWLKIYDCILMEKERIHSFLFSSRDNEPMDIVLSGAGSSAFIGEILAFTLPEYKQFNYRPVSTTDLTTHAENLFSKEKKNILVSFARSGNSPESVAVVKLAEKTCGKKTRHIAITCNADGLLAKEMERLGGLLITLPEETNDKALAMTSSFTGMLLACWLTFNVKEIAFCKTLINEISANAKSILEQYDMPIKKIAELDFDRAVFLGSGALKGVAEECHLKLQELTDGKVICKFDSFLGFRHGPKAVLNDKTLIVYLFSSDRYVQQYEKDLVNQINRQIKPIAQIGVSKGIIKFDADYLDLQVLTNGQSDKADSAALYVIPGQLLGLYKSLHLGLNPDSPSSSGKIARVVEGVKIYETTEL